MRLRASALITWVNASRRPFRNILKKRLWKVQRQQIHLQTNSLQEMAGSLTVQSRNRVWTSSRPRSAKSPRSTVVPIKGLVHRMQIWRVVVWILKSQFHSRPTQMGPCIIKNSGRGATLDLDVCPLHKLYPLLKEILAWRTCHAKFRAIPLIEWLIPL